MENNKSKANIHNRKSPTASTPAYLKELDKMIQNHTNLITKKLSSETSENLRSEAEKIHALKKSCLKVLSYIDEDRLKSAIFELETSTQNNLKNLEEFSCKLFKEPEMLLSSNQLITEDESLIDLISTTNESIQKKHKSLIQKINFYEFLDLKSIKKLQGIYQENSNNKAFTNFLVQQTPLQRELSYILENLEGKKIKLSEKENTNKFNSSKAEAYRKELDSTSEKYKNALAKQESCELEYSQLTLQKEACEAELAYIQENFTEKINKKGKKIKCFRFKDTDEKAKMLNVNNQICLQEIEKSQMLNYDLRKSLANLKIVKAKEQEAKEIGRKFFFDAMNFKILQMQFDKAQAQVKKIEQEEAFTVEVLKLIEILAEEVNKHQQLEEENTKKKQMLEKYEKQFDKFQKISEKIMANNPE